jgi:hypothetical protein
MGALEVLAGMVVLALGLWFAAQALSWWWSRDEKRTAALAAQAERLVMDFVATDALHVTWELPLCGFGSQPGSHDIVYGTWSGVPMRVFDYAFDPPTGRWGGRRAWRPPAGGSRASSRRSGRPARGP